MKKNACMTFALLAAVLSGCAAHDDDLGSNAEIRVGAGVITTQTKAPIITGSEFTAAITAVEVTTPTAPPDWTAEPADGSWWQNSFTLVASPSIGAKQSLDIPRNYDATRTTCLAAWYPNVKSASGIVTFTDNTGTTDVMWGGTLRGSRETPISAAFNFTHALTQLNFVVRASGDYLQAPSDGVSISGIEVEAARLPRSLNIGNGTLTCDAPAPLAVPGSTTLKLAAVAKPFGLPLMIGAQDQVQIKVTYEDAEGEKTAVALITDTTVNPAVPLRVLAGKSHKITLILGKNGLDVSAKVEEWADGNGGEVII